jgi:hypothetical protein
MAKYRIFTNDRGRKNGVSMYSGFKDVEAPNSDVAKMLCPPLFDAPSCAPAKAIRWPERYQSDEEKEWLKVHVHG